MIYGHTIKIPTQPSIKFKKIIVVDKKVMKFGICICRSFGI